MYNIYFTTTWITIIIKWDYRLFLSIGRYRYTGIS